MFLIYNSLFGPKAKQMKTISVCVPYVELPLFMNAAFVKRAFEKDYGEGSVKDVDFVPKGDGNFFTLFVHLECSTDEALSMIAALNSGKTLLLDVMYHEFWEGASVVKTVKWRCVKARRQRPPMPSAEKLLGYALARESSAKLQEEQYTRRAEKNERTIKQVMRLVPKSATLVTLGHLTREASEHATYYKDAVYNARHSLDISRVEDEEEHGTGSAKLEALEARLFTLEVLNTNLVQALTTASEQIALIKIQQELLYKQHKNVVKD